MRFGGKSSVRIDTVIWRIICVFFLVTSYRIFHDKDDSLLGLLCVILSGALVALLSGMGTSGSLFGLAFFIIWEKLAHFQKLPSLLYRSLHNSIMVDDKSCSVLGFNLTDAGTATDSRLLFLPTLLAFNLLVNTSPSLLSLHS